MVRKTRRIKEAAVRVDDICVGRVTVVTRKSRRVDTYGRRDRENLSADANNDSTLKRFL